MPQPLAAAPNRRATILRVLAPATLLLGYADLARGGMTLAPILLVVGYCVLVPAMLLEWP